MHRYPPGVAHPLPIGTRVYVTKVYADQTDPERRGPTCRFGTIVEHKPQNGGYLVRHDEPEDMGVWGQVALFGWGYDEVSPIQ